MYALNKILNFFLETIKCKKLISGNYIQEIKGKPVIDYQIYSAQIILWIAISLISKLIVTNFEIIFKTPLILFSWLIFLPLGFTPDIKLFFVVIIFPLFANTLFFWISDNILKKKQWSQNEERIRTSYFEENQKASL